MATITELKWQTMTAVVNKIKRPRRFLSDLLFGRAEVLSTETIELDRLIKGRTMAPFILKNGEAVSVAGHSERYDMIEAPSIRIKRPLTPSELLFNRRPGTVIFPEAGEQLSAIQAHIARDLSGMRDMVDNRLEWMASQALTMTVDYQSLDEASFTITFPRDAGNSVNAGTEWGTATFATIEKDVRAVKKQMAEEGGVQPTDAICSAEATDNLLAIADIFTRLDQNNVALGGLDFTTQYNESGAIFLGSMFGMRWWSYPAQLNGADLIRAGYVEFVNNTPAADWVTYYAAIPDYDALEGRAFQGQFFSKSWIEPDPSHYVALLHTRPLPVPRNMEASMSMDTTP